MQDLKINPKFHDYAVALSGGADSWALTLLAQDWCKKHNIKLTALTVDHKLRDNSTAEAVQVAAQCQARGIPHHILTWQHEGPITTRLQEQARDARYQLLTNYCRTNSIPALLLAHHADDLAETLLLRLAKASDVGGLAGMAPVSQQHGLTILRPLLQFTKKALEKIVHDAGITPVTDPSNQNLRFARPRLRAAQPALAAEGFNSRNMVRFAEKMHAADQALHWTTAHFLLSHLRVEACGLLTLPLALLWQAPAALQHRALQHIWRVVTGETAYPLPYEQVKNALLHLQRNQTRLTLGGMQLESVGPNLLAWREVAACAAPLTINAGATAVWDRRFIIQNHSAAPINVGALGVMGRAKINALGKNLGEKDRTNYDWLQRVPHQARASLPALYGADNRRLPLALLNAAENGISATFHAIKSGENCP